MQAYIRMWFKLDFNFADLGNGTEFGYPVLGGRRC